MPAHSNRSHHWTQICYSLIALTSVLCPRCLAILIWLGIFRNIGQSTRCLACQGQNNWKVLIILYHNYFPFWYQNVEMKQKKTSVAGPWLLSRWDYFTMFAFPLYIVSSRRHGSLSLLTWTLTPQHKHYQPPVMELSASYGGSKDRCSWVLVASLASSVTSQFWLTQKLRVTTLSVLE